MTSHPPSMITSISRSFADLSRNLSSMVDKHKKKKKKRFEGISAKELSTLGYSICLFPEQPKQKQKKNYPYTNEWYRLYWRNRLFLLAGLFSHGLSLTNIFEFPIHIWEYGPIFLIPYCLNTILVGFPMHNIQASMGQYYQRGPFHIWTCAPIFYPLGGAMIASCLIKAVRYAMFSVYSLVYFSRCFNKFLPWTYCQDAFFRLHHKNSTCAPAAWYHSKKTMMASTDYFYHIVLNTPHTNPPSSISIGPIKWWLLLALLFCWIFVYVSIMRGPRSLEKSSAFSVAVCYFAMITLLVLAFYINYAGDMLLLTWSDDLFDFKMWTTALMQVINELGISHGVPIMYGSYCRFRSKIYIDSIIVCLVNCVHSVVFLFLFFSFLKVFICDFQHTPFQLPNHSHSIVYIVYSEAIALLPGRCCWCLIFFLMLFLVTLGTVPPLVECVMTAIFDNRPRFCVHRWKIAFLLCAVMFFIDIFLCTTDGYYGVVTYQTKVLLLIPFTLIFLLGVLFGHGYSDYVSDIKEMLHYKLSKATKVYLGFLTVYLMLMTLLLFFSMDAQNTDLPRHNFIIGSCGGGILLFPALVSGVWLLLIKVRGGTIKKSKLWKDIQERRREKMGQFTMASNEWCLWPWNVYGKEGYYYDDDDEDIDETSDHRPIETVT